MGDQKTRAGFAPDWVAFERQIGFRPLLHAPLPNMLKEWDELGTALVAKLTFPTPDPSVHTADKEISKGLTVRIYTPPSAPLRPLPIGLFIHGGGWAMGDLESDDEACRRICKGICTTIVSVDYRLAPEHPYPAGLDDCMTTLKWAISSASSFSCEPDSAVVLGFSAGGNLAISTVLKAIDAGLGDKIKGLVAVVPVTVHPDCLPKAYQGMHTSYVEHSLHTVNSESAMEEFFNVYGAAKDDVYVSSLLNSNLAKLPRTYVCWCEMDTLRDDGRLFNAELEKQGVSHTYDEFKGYPHYFWTFPSEHLKESSENFYMKLLTGINFVLNR